MQAIPALFQTVLDEHSLLALVLANLVILAATSVQYALGIAFGLIAAPLLALISIQFVPVPVLFLTAITALLSVRSEWRAVDWREAGTAISGRAVGSLAGIAVLTAIPDEKTFMLIFGLMIALAVVISISGLRIPFNLASVAIAGTVSGLTASITSVGGPPMAVVYQRRSAGQARPNLQAFFAIGALVTLALLHASNHVTSRDIALAVLLLPGLASGYLAGPFVRRRVDRNFRMLLLSSAAVSALLLIWRSLA